jgi:hypothetical protein
MAEREGFEPPIPVKVYTLSRRAPSATRPSLRATSFIFILSGKLLASDFDAYFTELSPVQPSTTASVILVPTSSVEPICGPVGPGIVLPAQTF